MLQLRICSDHRCLAPPLYSAQEVEPLQKLKKLLEHVTKNERKEPWPFMTLIAIIIKGSLGGDTSVLRTFRMSGKELVKERVSKETVSQGKS